MGLVALVLGVAILSALLCGAMQAPSSALRVEDRPNHRSLHERATPSSGGLAIMAALLIGGLLAISAGYLVWQPSFVYVVFGFLALTALGYWDDHKHLGALPKLLPQMLVAAAGIAGGWYWQALPLPGDPLPWAEWLGRILSAIYILWMINLYNFMDGMDGLAAGQALFGFGGMAVFGYLADHQAFVVANILVLAAVVGFWVWNFPPAKLFMGDAGSLPMGYLAACFCLWGGSERIFPMWIGLLLFAPFIVDATWTLVRRALQGKSLFQAHREHAYQRLVLTGWGHRKTVLAAYALMAVGVASAIALATPPVWVQWLGVAAWILVYWRILHTVIKWEVS